MPRDPSFEIRVADDAPVGDVLLIGLTDVGTASLTAADYLVTSLETTQIGHVAARNLPIGTPVEAGAPRHPIRLYAVEETSITILVSEVFVPVSVADPFAEAVFEWATDRGIEELGVLHGVPFPHSETEHRLFYAATQSYRQDRFEETAPSDLEPLPGGVLDGVNGELLVRASRRLARRWACS
ncbi:proteasome assembly chaperone family protein [Halopiger thermotolerans]